MKYTRYNIKSKQKKSNNFLFYLAITLLIALLLGSFVVKFILKDSGKIGFGNMENKGQVEDNSKEKNLEDDKNGDDSKENDKVGSDEVAATEYNFYILQCGVFKVKENAAELMSKLGDVGMPFIGEEGEFSKVYFGIYSSENIEEGVNILKGKSIDNTKVSINIPVEDISTTQLYKIIDGLLQIVNKTSESGVKSVNTAEFKNWVKELEPIEDSMKEYKEVTELKEYINALPEDVNKEGIKDMPKFIYDKLIRFKK
ncbi:SPOR domain-containing protein [Clostridium sp.]|uniref:SPOR domain-containing protein n=1 Tax=Clostridium sp. TaxID=1506 RepID=UPI00321632F1